jgi:hypothetical protein
MAVASFKILSRHFVDKQMNEISLRISSAAYLNTRDVENVSGV